MSPRVLHVLALVGLLGTAGLALSLRPRVAPAAVPRRMPAAAPARPAAPASVAPSAVSRFSALPALHVMNETTRESLDVRLYDAAGQIDEGAAAQLDGLLCDARRPKHHETTRLNRRTLQLMFKAAYHFASYQVEVVSAYRKPGRRREGPHGTGSAIDFRLQGVSAAMLAAYLRETPRTGVGVYTHPKTQYVHIDSREQSFHWLDASPPRRRWREKSIGAADLLQRDHGYTPTVDWPEGMAPGVTAAAAP